MGSRNEVVLRLVDVSATKGWFSSKHYDLIITKKDFLLVRAPRRTFPEFMRVMADDELDALDAEALRTSDGAVVIPHDSIASVRFVGPPIQSNQTYSNFGITLQYHSQDGRSAKITLAINGYPYQISRMTKEDFKGKMSTRTLKMNRLLAEYGETVKSAVFRQLPPKVVVSDEWKTAATI